MGYDKYKLFEKAKEIVPKEKVVFIEELVSYLPCNKSTFYDLFPIGSNESDEIKELINDNKVKTKVKLRKQWEDSESASLQIGLYKLLGTEEERERLNTSYQKGEQTVTVTEQPLFPDID